MKKKSVLALLLVLVMCVTLCACGGSSTESGDSSTTGTEAELPVLNVGDTVTSEDWEITLTKAEFASAIYPEDPNGTYYEHDAGTKFCNLEFDVTNLYTETLSFANAVDNVVLTCGDYVYEDHYYYYDMGGSMSVIMLTGDTHGPDPLTTLHMYVELDVPDAAAELGGTVELTVAGKEYKINIQ